MIIYNSSISTDKKITLQEKIVTPTSSTQNITSDAGYDGLSLVTVAGDSDLVAANIKKDIEIFGITGTYEEGVKTYTLGIKTENPNSNTDYVYYYYYNESGMREKTSVYLTTSYQTITFCDGFLAVYKGGNNVTATINFYDSYDNKVTSINVNGNYEYGIWINPTGYTVLNIAFLLEKYPNIEKISFDYMD